MQVQTMFIPEDMPEHPVAMAFLATAREAFEENREIDAAYLNKFAVVRDGPNADALAAQYIIAGYPVIIVKEED